jgi:serine/threonine-protein kinase RsbT
VRAKARTKVNSVMDDATGGILAALSHYFPAEIARAIHASTLRRARLEAGSLAEASLPEFVSALEQALPMYIVDPTRRGECLGAVRRLLPDAVRDASPASSTVRVRTAREVLQASDTARQTALRLGFSGLDQTKIATAVSELARNILLYVGDGEVRITTIDAPRRGLEIVASDSGSGIADVSLVMDAGYRSRTGMGKGLKGTKRLMDSLEIVTRPGAGTVVTARKFLP